MKDIDKWADIHAVERKIYRTFWNDGLLDIVFGLGIGLIGLAWAVDLAELAVVVPLVLLPVWTAGRRWVTIPRAGFVRFSSEREARVHRSLVVASIIGYGILMALGATYAYLNATQIGVSWLEPVIGSIPALVLAGVLLAGALVFDMPLRSLGYAALILVAAGLGMVLTIEPSTQFVGAGLLILLIGVAILSRFVKENPLEDTAQIDGGSHSP
jgi:hypothetical protein